MGECKLCKDTGFVIVSSKSWSKVMKKLEPCKICTNYLISFDAEGIPKGTTENPIPEVSSYQWLVLTQVLGE